MRIGILGGSFDPIHNGHIFLAKKALKKLCLDKIIFIPCYIPPHKKNIKLSPAKHRLNMIKLAIKGNKGFIASDIEVKRKGRSYTIDTLRQLKKRYGKSAEFFFIAGSDALEGLHKWKNLPEILKLCRFVIVKRPGFLIRKKPKDIIILDINAKDISATDIRKRQKKGQSINRLVPKK